MSHCRRKAGARGGSNPRQTNCDEFAMGSLRKTPAFSHAQSARPERVPGGSAGVGRRCCCQPGHGRFGLGHGRLNTATSAFCDIVGMMGPMAECPAMDWWHLPHPSTHRAVWTLGARCGPGAANIAERSTDSHARLPVDDYIGAYRRHSRNSRGGSHRVPHGLNPNRRQYSEGIDLFGKLGCELYPSACAYRVRIGAITSSARPKPVQPRPLRWRALRVPSPSLTICGHVRNLATLVWRRVKRASCWEPMS